MISPFQAFAKKKSLFSLLIFLFSNFFCLELFLTETGGGGQDEYDTKKLDVRDFQTAFLSFIFFSTNNRLLDYAQRYISRPQAINLPLHPHDTTLQPTEFQISIPKCQIGPYPLLWGSGPQLEHPPAPSRAKWHPSSDPPCYTSCSSAQCRRTLQSYPCP